MAYLTWQDDLNTGIQVIDDQHKRIVDMINLLHQAQEHGRSRSEVGDVLNELVDYTLSHFAFEESLLEEAGYEFSRPHKRVHEIFIGRVSDYNLRFKAGEDITQELIGLLSRWLFNHIRTDDAGYVQAVKDNMNTLVSDKRAGGWFSRSIKQFFN
ncbi:MULTISPECIES: bacteriohemerythrin [unclassified Pseudomonas]|uniref:bacteriohemerythrin n=1 Tax=unclassified Pseudomonas TaxID=196821 RepID=UPI0010F46FD6|nr:MULTISPECIES: bacteriohemerythrin [unclassified Pseudomonas]